MYDHGVVGDLPCCPAARLLAASSASNFALSHRFKITQIIPNAVREKLK